MSKNPFDDFFVWPKDRDVVCARIMKSPAAFKIVLKTRDEIELLPMWLKWHSDICSFEDIIIFDHGSINPDIADLYKAVPELTVCRYEGHVDGIHHRENFAHIGALYDALSASAKYSMIIDTDEFLTYAKDAVTHDRRKIGEFIAANADVEIFPCSWLYGLRASRTKVHLSYWKDLICGTGMIWGKPLVNGKTKLFGEYVLHNEFITGLTKDTIVRNNLLLLHLNSYSKARQIRVSLYKMAHNGVLPHGATADQAVAMATANVWNGDPKGDELLRFKALVEDLSAWTETSVVPPGSMEFCDDGRITHPNPQQEAKFQAFLDDRGYYMRLMEEWRRRVI